VDNVANTIDETIQKRAQVSAVLQAAEALYPDEPQEAHELQRAIEKVDQSVARGILLDKSVAERMAPITGAASMPVDGTHGHTARGGSNHTDQAHGTAVGRFYRVTGDSRVQHRMQGAGGAGDGSGHRTMQGQPSRDPIIPEGVRPAQKQGPWEEGRGQRNTTVSPAKSQSMALLQEVNQLKIALSRSVDERNQLALEAGEIVRDYETQLTKSDQQVTEAVGEKWGQQLHSTLLGVDQGVQLDKMQKMQGKIMVLEATVEALEEERKSNLK